MTAEDRAMWAREAKRLANKIAYKQQVIKEYQDEIPELERRRSELLDKIAEDYDEERNS